MAPAPPAAAAAGANSAAAHMQSRAASSLRELHQRKQTQFLVRSSAVWRALPLRCPIYEYEAATSGKLWQGFTELFCTDKEIAEEVLPCQVGAKGGARFVAGNLIDEAGGGAGVADDDGEGKKSGRYKRRLLERGLGSLSMVTQMAF